MFILISKLTSIMLKGKVDPLVIEIPNLLYPNARHISKILCAGKRVYSRSRRTYDAVVFAALLELVRWLD